MLLLAGSRPHSLPGRSLASRPACLAAYTPVGAIDPSRPGLACTTLRGEYRTYPISEPWWLVGGTHGATRLGGRRPTACHRWGDEGTRRLATCSDAGSGVVVPVTRVGPAPA